MRNTKVGLASKLTLASLALAAVFTTASFDAQARQISYASASPPTETGINKALSWWAQELESRTDGEVSVNVHYMGSLVKLKDAVGGISSGVADAGYVIPAYSQARMPLHYLSTTAEGSGDQYVTMEAWRRMYDKFPQLQEELDRNNMVYLSHYSIGPGVLISKDTPFFTPDDFGGKKIRLASLWAKAASLEPWNVNPVNLTFPDIYTALGRGTIDGAQSYLNYVIPYRHHEIVNHVVEPSLGQQTNIVVMNKRVYENLSQKTRAVIEELKGEWLVRQARGDIEDNLNAREELENHPEYPTKVHQLNEEQRKVWAEAVKGSARDNLEQTAKRNSIAKELYGAYLEEINIVAKEVEQNGYPWE
ncbi:TRAP transporter substrate-binding protein DctP [Pseudomonas sp. gcc21]|uniref:TRAP transporter substrate-binding protein DctP n=1 Tax=Pseudomonas sp. gcc21 TaxID=2726989 RepID=UPI001451DA19|nr:TRAP transporter substrate-binding protein DctP [Pseudomonas sp. gcc21]QJD59898.1 TRAP transporter substrate-binding protein DctP [Pseudomonas sp. gcc21]